jgi:hypothetical protein
MWQSIVAIVLLPTLTAAETRWQTAPTAPQETAQGTSSASASLPAHYESYTFYDAIRCGTTEEVAVDATTAGFVVVPKSPVAGIVPLKLELQTEKGLIFGTFRYPKAYPRTLTSQSKPVKMAWRALIRFSVRAEPNATVGERVIRGKLTFQPIRYDSTIGAVQELDIEIPIDVVAHNAKVSRKNWPMPHTPTEMMVAMIVLSPVIIPLSVLYYTVCGIEGSQRCPD